MSTRTSTPTSTTASKTSKRKKTEAAAAPSEAAPKKAKKGSRQPHLRVRRIAGRILVVHGKVAKIAHGDAGLAAGMMHKAHELMMQAAAKLEAIPADQLVPAKAAAKAAKPAKPELKEGAMVAIKAARRGEFEGLVTAEEMDQLTLHSIRKGKISCKTLGGAKLFFKPTDLQVVAAAT